MLKKIAHARALEPARQCDLSQPARQLLDTGMTPAVYLDALVAGGHQMDAVRFLSQALPIREAVWWGCVCARTSLTEDAPPPVLAAQNAAQAWVYQPTDAHRRQAFECAQATDFQWPSSWAAVAAFWSGGSMAPPGNPIVPPPLHLAGNAVSAAVILSAVRHKPELASSRFAAFIDSGTDIASGGNGRIRELEPAAPLGEMAR
jgi:hypothetical protein